MVQVDIGKWRYRTSKHTALAPFINVFTGCDSDMSSHQRSDYVFNWVPKATSVYFQSGAYGCLSMTPVQVLMLQTKMSHTPTVYPGCGRGNESRLSLQGVWRNHVWQIAEITEYNEFWHNWQNNINPPTYPSIHSSIQTVHQFTCPFIYLCFHLSVEAIIHPFIHSSVNPSIRHQEEKGLCHFCHFLRIFPT